MISALFPIKVSRCLLTTHYVFALVAFRRYCDLVSFT